MISNELLNELLKNGINASVNNNSKKSNAFAVYNGYLVTVYESAKKICIYVNFKFKDDEDSLTKFKLSEALSSLDGSLSVIDYSIEEDGLRVTSSCNYDDVFTLITDCTNILKEFEIRGVEYCSECGNKFGARSPKRVTDGIENRIMCEHCAIMNIEEARKTAEANENNSIQDSPVKGILGSILFAVLGAVIYVLSYTFICPWVSGLKLGDIRFILCALGCLVAFLSYFGYRLFCKRISKASYITISVTGILFTSVGQFLGSVFGFISGGGYSWSSLTNKHFWLVHLRNTIPEDRVNDFVNYSGEFYKLLGISLLFAVIGIAILLLTLRDKSKPKSAEIFIETITID